MVIKPKKHISLSPIHSTFNPKILKPKTIKNTFHPSQSTPPSTHKWPYPIPKNNIFSLSPVYLLYLLLKARIITQKPTFNPQMLTPKLEDPMMNLNNSDSLDSLHSLNDTKPPCGGNGARGICEDGRILAISASNINPSGISPSNNTSTKTSSELPKDSTSEFNLLFNFFLSMFQYFLTFFYICLNIFDFENNVFFQE